MKKGFTLMLLLFSFWLLSAFSMQDLADAPITPELVKEIQYRNSLVRGYGWSPGTPTALPTVPGTFLEDGSYEFDFAPYISLTGSTTLDSMYIAWSQSSFFTISKPDPINFPFKLLFEPTTAHFYGTRPVWVSLYQIVGGVYVNPVSVGINVTVTNIPTDPDFSFPSVDDPNAVSADYIFETLEETSLTLDFVDIVTIYDGNVSGTTPRNFDLYITQTAFPNNIVFTQSTNNNGQVVTFTPNENYFGTQYFIVTAVDKVAPYQWASTTFGINVINVNDDPVIDSFSPPSPVVLNQGETQVFSVVASDVDFDTLSYTWTFSGVLNGAPFANVVSTTSSWTNDFINPGNFVLTLVIDDGNGSTVTQVWQITVNPKGPQFDPEGDTFSTSVVNATFGTPGVVLSVTGITNPELATIWFTTSSSNPTVPVYPTPQIYTQPIPISVPPQDYTYTITAWFTHPDYAESQHNTQVYVLTGIVETPVFTEAPGLIRSNERYPVHITCPTAGATIFYSYDGGPWTEYTIPIMVPAHTVASLRAYATKTNWVDSAITADHVYDVRRYVVFNAPLMDTYPLPDAEGFYCVCLHDSVWVNFTGINTLPPEATIYYQVQAGINVGAGAIDPYSNPAPILIYDPLNPPDWSIYSTSTIVWWAEYTPAVGLPYLISDIHRYPIPVKNRTRMTLYANGTVFNPPAGTYTNPQNVYINTTTDPANAPIWYSLNGGPFMLYSGGAIYVNATTTIEAYAGEMPPTTTLPSLHQTALYNITGTLPAPLISPPGYPDVTVYDTDQAITLSMPVGDPRWASASLYYTTDGTNPTTSSNLYSGPFTLIQGHWTVKAIAVLPDWISSSIAQKQYYIKFLTPVTFLPEATEHYSAINVEMYAYTGAEIRYTEDGTDPNPSSNLYSAPIPLAINPDARYTRNFKAKAFIPGWLSEAAASKSYTMIPTVLNPFFNPADSIQATPIMVTIDCLTPGVTIYYTLDGSDPSPTNGTMFTGPFELSTTTTVRARAYKTNFRPSEIVRMPYIIGNIIGALIFTPPAGTYDTAQNVSIIASPPNAQIYYTVDGTLPIPGVAGTYLFDPATPIHLGLNSTSTINAIATLTSWQASSGSATYVITGTLAAPDIDPDVYEYAVGTVVNVSIAAPMGTIWYRINGGVDQVYTGSFDITTNTTVEAWTVHPDWITSPVVSATYTFNSNLTPPLITPISGVYNTNVQCVITSLQNADIYYSTDGSAPSILYTYGAAGFTVDRVTTVRALARKANWLDSAEAQAIYNLKVPNPVFSLPAGAYATVQTVSLSVSSGDAIYYTLDGSVPSATNPNAVLYTIPITINGYTRIRAIAIHTDWLDSDIVEAIYTINGQLTAPVFSLTGGIYFDEQTVTITAYPDGASIYYWLNGATADSTLYSVPLSISENTAIRARAYLANWVPSADANVLYQLKVKPITSTPQPGVFFTPTAITLATLTPGTTIYYTTDGSVPGLTSPVYSGAIVVNETTRIRAIAYKNLMDWLPSDEFDQNFVISQQVATPVFNPEGGVFTYSPVNVSLSCSTPGATIWYSLDGGAWLEYTAPLALTNTTTVVRAYATRNLWVDSPQAVMNYIISIPVVTAVEFDPLPGVYNNPLSVSLTTGTAGAEIYYTTDGGAPDSLYTSPIIVATTTTIQAQAVLAGYTPSAIVSGTYTISPLTVLSPVLLPEPGIYNSAVTLRMYARTPDSTIRFTLDGGAEMVYDDANPPVLNATTTVVAWATKTGMQDSATVGGLYTITGQVQLAALLFDPLPGIYTTAQNVTINTLTTPMGATLRYTTDGSDPTATSPVYSGAIPISSGTITIKVRAYLANWIPSNIASGIYTITGAVVISEPVFTPAAGTYQTTQMVSVNPITVPAGATIRYTTDGSEPSESSAIYVTPLAVPLNSSLNLKVKAFLADWTPSPTYEATYNVTGQVALGAITPVAGTYPNQITVSLGAANPADATVYYTLDGSEPTPASLSYTGSFALNAIATSNVMVKAKAFKADWTSSPTVAASYTFQAEAPSFNPPSGSYGVAVNVSLTSGTQGAMIYYTTDGSDPTDTNGMLYSTPIEVSQTLTIKSRAYNGAYLPSPISAATYGIGTNLNVVSLPTFDPLGGIYATAQNVQIFCGTAGATIRYTTDGTDPTESYGTIYTGAINIPLGTTVTIRAMAYRTGWISSQVATSSYTITGQVLPVAFNPPAGTYTSAQNVVLTSPTPGAYIRYTTDGADPDAGSPLYTTAVLVNISQTIKAKAFKEGWMDSNTNSAQYVITGSTAFNQPVFSPAPGTYDTAQWVSIADPIPPTAQVWYTLDGSIPGPSNPNSFIYTGPILVDGNANLQVSAFEPGWDNPVINGVYTFNAAAPTYDPIPGYYASSIDVAISTATAGATIYYTVDGSDPSTSSLVYNAPINISGDTTFKAIAIKASYSASPIATGIYGIGGTIIPTVGAPIFDPIAGTYTTAQNVSITSATPGAIIRYTTDGSIPTETTGTIYAAPIALSLNSYTMIRAIAYQTGFYSSPVVTSIYNITGQVSDVIFTPPAGTYNSTQVVTLSSLTPGAYFRYTTDGSEPDGTSPLFTAGIPIPMNSQLTIKAKAYKDGWLSSNTGTAIYNVTGTTTFNQPVFSPAPGTYANGINVQIAAPIPANALVYYSLDGSYPTIPYTGAIPMDANTVIRAIAVLPDWITTEVSGSYSFKAAVPTFNPPAGYYESTQYVALSTLTSGATIKYTTDGSIPSIVNGIIYSAPIEVAANQTIRAYAYKAGYQDSDLAAAAYTIGINIPVVANPVFNPPSTTSFTALNVSITTSTENASIRYTTDGSDPTDTYGTLYSGAINVPQNSNLYIKAIAYREGWNPSAIVSANYLVTGTVEAVSFNPPGGIYTTAQNVLLSTITEGATIRYTIDGSEPDAMSPIYTFPINVPLNSSLTIKAKAYRIGWQPSVTVSHTYNVTGAVAFNQPVFTPASGIFGNQIMVSIAAPLPADASVYYTLDGTDPTAMNGILYTAPVMLNQAATLKAIAIKDNWLASPVETANYMFQADAPNFAPPGGAYATSQTVVLTTTTAGASIRYTTDGSIPSATNGSIYENPILVNINQTIMAYSFKAGYLDSPIISHTYAIGTYVPVVATPEFNPAGGIYQTAQNVSISVSTAGATIRFTTDGTDPSDSYGTIYTGPVSIPLNSTMTIKAIAYRAEWLNSQIATATYVITGQVASVVFTPPAGTYPEAQNVVLTSFTEGAYFRYTTDGTEPNATSPLYVTAIPVPLNSTLTIKAKAYKTNWIPSETGTAVYNITGQVVIPEPVFTPAAGTYTAIQNVNLGIPIPVDAIIRYTTDGSDPLSSSPAYTGAISMPLGTVTTLKVRAFKANWVDSPIYTAVYNITGQVVLPANMFDPPSGTYQNAQIVHLMGSTVPAGAILRYTVNGGEPNELSPAYDPASGIAINGTSTLKVKGFLPGWIPSETSQAVYNITGQITINAPVFTPAAGTYTTAQAIVIGSVSPSTAQIRYTLNGSEPTESSPLYTAPLVMPLNSVTTLKVKAFQDTWTPSVTHTAVYNITGQVAMITPVFTPNPGVYTQPVAVAINTVTIPVGATIRYTMDGSDPNETSPLYSAPIQLSEGQVVTLRARAFLNGWIPSEIHTANYAITGQVQIVAPVFTPDPAVVYPTPQNVVISTITLPAGATVRYTLDGSEPGETSPIYSQPLPLALNTITTVKAKAFLNGWISSVTYSATYVITGQVNISGITLNPPAGVYQTAQTINTTGSLVPADAVLRYTTDGTDPVATSPVFTPLSPTLPSTLNLKLRGFKENWTPSAVLSAAYIFTGQVVLNTPMFTPPAGTYQTQTSVTLNTTTVPTGATLRYTLNGVDPTESSPAYSGTPIQLPMNATTTLKVRGFMTNWTPSAVMTAVYNITGQVAFLTPVFAPAAGTYTEPITITVNETIPADATIRYTTNGTEPTATSPIYNEPISLTQMNATHTIKVKAFKTDWTSSLTQTAVYVLTGQASIASPVFSPAPNIYTQAQTVTINQSTVPTNAIIRYTTDGTDPTVTSQQYTAPITVNSTTTIRARAFATDWTPSVVYVGAYIITGQASISGTVFDPPAGTYSSAQALTINTGTNPPGATIHYTLDGSEPSETSPVYSTAIALPLDSQTTVKARVYATDWIPSITYQASYTITGQVNWVGELFDPEAGTYNTTQNIHIIADTYPAAATIRYTIDGSDPTAQSAEYDEQTVINVPLNSTLLLKARAFHPNWVDSPIITAQYVVTGQVELPADLFSIVSGTYTTAQQLVLNTNTYPEGATLRYTLNGTDPDEQAAAYNPGNPIVLPLDSQTTVKVRGFKPDWIPSEIATAVYTITGTVATPVFSHPEGLYAHPFKLGISSATAGATIRYTLDGTDVSETSPAYTDSLMIEGIIQNMVIKAKAYKADWIASEAIAGTYSLLSLPINIRLTVFEGYIRVLWNSPEVTRALQGFNVYRRRPGETSYTKLNSTLVNSMIGLDYYYDDYAIESNVSYQYYVTAVYDGQESLPSDTASVEYQATGLLISETSNVYPNPAETATTFKIVLNRNDNVQIAITIYDFAGKKIKTLAIPNTNSNLVLLPWDLKNDSGTKVARGTYFARVVVNDSINRYEKVIKIAVK